MAAASGQYGAILVDGTLVLECTEWSMAKKVAECAYADTSTEGWRARLVGTKEAEGQCAGLLDPNDPIHNYFGVGDYVTLKLYYSISAYFQVPATVQTLETRVNVEDGDVIRWTMGWGSNGEITDGSSVLTVLVLNNGHGILLDNGHALLK